MDEWPHFVIESPADDPTARRGHSEVVFEVEDSLAENDAEIPGVIRETR